VGARLHAGISLTGLCLVTGEILLCNDTNTDRRVDSKLCKETGIKSVLVLPIKQNAKVVGVLEVLSINPNAFSQHDATAMSNLADRVLAVSSESATISGQCHDQFPNKDIEVIRNVQKLLGIGNELKEHNNCRPATAVAEASRSNGHNIQPQLPDQAVTIASRERSGATHWLKTGLASALAVAVTCGYLYHLNHPRVATHIAPLPIAATSRMPAFPTPRHMLSEQDKNTNGRPKAWESVLKATQQEATIAIQQAVQVTDGNRMINRSNSGDSVAQYEMALRYANGEGVPQNYQNAMAWFAKAASNGNNNAQWKIGLGYIKGIGVPHDEGKAAVWFKRAANHGDIRAQSALGDLYLNGRGVPRDYVRAYTWTSIATGMRESDNDRLRIMSSQMTVGQIEDAHRRISSWRRHQTSKAAPLVTSQGIGVSDVSEK
jgi:hypothetical protein